MSNYGKTSRLVLYATQGWARLQTWYVDLWPRPEVRLLLWVLVARCGIWFFAALTGEVLEGDVKAADEAILLAMRDPNDLSDPLGPLWFEEMVRDWTALGSIGVIYLFTGAGALYLFLIGRRGSALLLVITVIGAVLLNVALKMGFDRPRPELVPHESSVYQASFPSGHSMTATAAYLALGILAARGQRRRRVALLIMSFALLISVLVGVSRIYLGVHWPSDVLGGWIAGAVWALICALVAWWMRHSRIERQAPDADLPGAHPADKEQPELEKV